MEAPSMTVEQPLVSYAVRASGVMSCVTSHDDKARCAGPGRAWSAKEQGQYLFKLAGKKERFISAPVGLMDGIISCFDGLTRFFPGLEVSVATWSTFLLHTTSCFSICHLQLGHMHACFYTCLNGAHDQRAECAT